jgi:hypothetical protein
MHEFVALGDVELLGQVASTLAELIGRRTPLLAARLYGAVSVLRDEAGLRDGSMIEIHTQSVVDQVRALVSREEWTAAYGQGQVSDLADVLIGVAAEVRALPVGFFAAALNDEQAVELLRAASEELDGAAV